MKKVFERKSGQLVIASTEFSGKNYIDIRHYYKDKSGEFKPTQKGICLTPSEFIKLARVIKLFKDHPDFNEMLENDNASESE